jgi:mono/diheme cytochrome c family protein
MVMFEENPYKDDSASVQRGAILFDFHCAGCHGAGAQGNGPEEPDLEVKPPNLRKFAATRSDSAIASKMMSGSFSGMPAHKSQLIDKEMWDIVNFLKAISKI